MTDLLNQCHLRYRDLADEAAEDYPTHNVVKLLDVLIVRNYTIQIKVDMG